MLTGFGALALCLSSDGDMLSQWRGYADDANGVSIGFSKEALERTGAAAIFRGNRNEIVPVEYDPKVHLSLVEPLSKEISKIVRDGIFSIPRAGFNKSNANHYKGVLDAYTTELSKLVGVLFKCKHNAFREENEWRYMVMYARLTVGNTAKPLTIDLQYHPRKSALVPYIEVPLDQDDAISEVIIGPRHTTPVEIVQDFLRDSFPKAVVRKSVATYR
jgi:hypothetical protein